MSESAASPASAPAAAPASTTATTPVATAATNPAAAGLPAVAPRAHDVQMAAIEQATAQERAERMAATGQPAEGTAPASTAATPSAETKPADKPAETAKPTEDKNSPTARIAALAAENRQHKAALKTMEAKLAELQGASTTTAAEAKLLGEVRAALKKDPLEAFKLLGEEWGGENGIVARAAGYKAPTPEEEAAAKSKAEADATAARIKKLEDEREAEKTAAQKASEEQQRAGATKYVSEKMITSEKYPRLSKIAEEAAGEALKMVDEALAAAFQAGKRSSPVPYDMDESISLTHNALAGLEKFYTEQVERLGGSFAAQQAAAPQTAAAPVAPTAAPAAYPSVQANSQQRGPETLTPAVAGRLPPATQTRVLSADDARNRAIEAAAQLPPL